MSTSLKGTVSRYIDKNRTGACGLGRNRRLLRHTELVFLSTVCARRVVLVLSTNMDATIVVNWAGEVESIPPSTLCCLLISDARLVQYPSFPTVEALSSPVFNMTTPESSAPRLKQKVRLGFIAKELALFELFLRNNSHNSRDRQVFWLFLVCLSMEEALFRITITSANFLQNWFGLRFCLPIQI